MNFEVSAESDAGPRRTTNEDSIIVDTAANIYLVCDGMGGEAFGKLASETVSAIIRDTVVQRVQAAAARGPKYPEPAEIEPILRHAIQTACSKLSEMAKGDPRYSRMGTTATMLFIRGTRGYMAHVGDSRLLLIRAGQVHQLSRDHTIVNDLVAAGQVEPELARSHPFAHVLSRSIGASGTVQVDTLGFEILPGDSFLLCSDGLTNAIFPNAKLADYFANVTVQEAATALIRTANELDGSDNVSVIAIHVPEQPQESRTQRERIDTVMLKLDRLSQLPLFRSLSLEQLLRVMEIAKAQSAQDCFPVVREGEERYRMYIILQGEVVVTRRGQEIARLGPGEHFGEMALLSSVPRGATVTTLTPSQFLLIEQEDFRNLVHQDPQVGLPILWQLASELSNRLGKANEHI